MASSYSYQFEYTYTTDHEERENVDIDAQRIVGFRYGHLEAVATYPHYCTYYKLADIPPQEGKSAYCPA